ncbi:MAG: NAD(P)H-dependent oxidoreductase [Verrucomicrobia bacterium]|nr:NAD(P)H-dependent oxidoreductase [Verrucomicrobiota bacterium]
MNTTIQRETLLHQLNWRYATKQFDPQRKISPGDWATLEEALVLTPSSFGLQPWKFIVITDPAIRERLLPVSWGQRQVVDASHLVVFAIKKTLSEQDIDHYLGRIAEVRNVPLESLAGLRDMLIGSIIKGMDAQARKAWAARQVYIALGNFLNSAALLGIDAGPMEGFQPDQYDEILGLDQQGLSAVVIAAAGYRASDDKYAALPKVRFPRGQVIAHI